MSSFEKSNAKQKVSKFVKPCGKKDAIITTKLDINLLTGFVA